MVVSNGDGTVERTGAAAPVGKALTPAGRAELERSWASEVQKRVRSRAATVTVANDRDRGRQKPTPVTYDTLRLMASRNEWVRAILNIRKRQIAGVKWDVTLTDGDDASGAASKAAKSIKKLLQRPMMHGSAPVTTPWRQWISMLLEDLLVLDRMCVEKERDGNGWIVALYPVDGSTLRPNMDEFGHFHDDAYVQVVDGLVQARFGMEEVICGIYNPTTDVRYAGYGMSPLESLVVSVTADLHAAKFNASYFEKGSVPEGVLDLGEDVAPEDVDAFRMYWLSEIQGRPWSLPIIGGSKAPQFINWRESNRDMQFMEYQQWLLQKLCAVYEISQQELGQIEDVNRSTADSQDDSNERKGITPLLDYLKDLIDLEVIGEHGQGLGDYLEFTWEQVGDSADQINQKMQPMHAAGVVTGAEWRDAHGMDPDGDDQATHGKDGLRMHLKGDGQPLPSKEDADLQGTAAEQNREDDLQEQANAREDVVGDKEHERQKELGADGGEPAATGWKPADPDDPDVQSAMAEHDRQSGIGPRNVKKTAPDGYDRNPAMTRRTDSLEDVYERATHDLVEKLTELVSEVSR